MPPLSPARRAERARKAALSQTYGPDHPKMVEVDQNLAALRLEQAIAAAPALTDEQRSRLAELLLKPAVRS